ncbi:hypothetical protein M422DRAFT_780770 [Sphaerobolus stellatus SS14]|uniref:Uncharacterized protein n=1 Tax=Sphaerobolus stellatus (strain SS14) TaxID=990650 RepID=A0A0C9UZL3_SPHS4|nr:hypothetical protein M422DRAFT_780770 [Sphaerobolus stellatus SS14]
MSFTVNRVVTKLMRTNSRDQEASISQWSDLRRGPYGEIKKINRPNKKIVPVIDRAELLDSEDMAWLVIVVLVKRPFGYDHSISITSRKSKISGGWQVLSEFQKDD